MDTEYTVILPKYGQWWPTKLKQDLSRLDPQKLTRLFPKRDWSVEDFDTELEYLVAVETKALRPFENASFVLEQYGEHQGGEVIDGVRVKYDRRLIIAITVHSYPISTAPRPPFQRSSPHTLEVIVSGLETNHWLNPLPNWSFG